jgi:hypothetical protein
MKDLNGESVLKYATDYLFNPLDIKQPNNIRIKNREEYNSFLKDK